EGSVEAERLVCVVVPADAGFHAGIQGRLERSSHGPVAAFPELAANTPRHEGRIALAGDVAHLTRLPTFDVIDYPLGPSRAAEHLQAVVQAERALDIDAVAVHVVVVGHPGAADVVQPDPQ